MSENVPWARVKRLGNERIEALRSALEVATPMDCAALQAECRVWRQILELPNTIAAERDNALSSTADY